MTEVLVHRNLEMTSLSEDAQHKLAHRVLEIMHADYLRAGIPDSTVRAFANPDSEDSIFARQGKIHAAAERGTPYVGLYEDDTDDSELLAVAQVGSWNHSDAKAFGAVEQVQALIANLPVVDPERRPRGLHLFSTVGGEDIAKRGLAAVRYSLVPASASLRVSAVKGDETMQVALSELGAEIGPEAIDTIGSIEVPVVLRKLPPIEMKSKGERPDNAALLL